jgi:hypothetical protein
VKQRPDRVVGVSLLKTGFYAGKWRVRFVSNGKTHDTFRNTEQSARSFADQKAAELAATVPRVLPIQSRPTVSELPRTLSDWDRMLAERTTYVLNHPSDEAAQRSLKVAVDAAHSFRQNLKARRDEGEDVEDIRKATTEQLVDMVRIVNEELERRRLVTLIPEGQ